MDYATLTSTVENICENTFTAADHAMFAQQAEQKIYNTVHFPDLRKSCIGTTTDGNEYLLVPPDFLYMNSLALDTTGSGDYIYLINKDPNFIREAYPNASTKGTPKHYGHFLTDSLIFGPTPDSEYTVQINYGYYPESIVTASTTWLGDNFDSALLNGALVEALRFMKGEEDLVAMYDKLYIHAIGLLKTLGDGKLRTDIYRTGQLTIPVT